MQHTVGEMQKDLGRLKETVGQRDAQDKEAQSRLAALEERVTTLGDAVRRRRCRDHDTVRQAEGGGQGRREGQGAAEKRAAEQRATCARRHRRRGAEAGAAGRSRSCSRAPKLETGSIPAPAPAITFGEPAGDAGAAGLRRAARRRAVARCPAHELDGAARPARRSARLPAAALRGSARRLGPLPPGRRARCPARPTPTRCAPSMGVGRDGCFATTALGHPL